MLVDLLGLGGRVLMRLRLVRPVRLVQVDEPNNGRTLYVAPLHVGHFNVAVTCCQNWWRWQFRRPLPPTKALQAVALSDNFA